MPSMNVSPKQRPISSACAASVDARSMIAGAERARDRRRHAAAHRAARHGHGQDHERKHQRHRRQRLDAEPADIGGLGDHHAGAGAERDDVRPGEPQQRAQDRPVDQRILRRRLGRRQRTLLLVYGYFGDGDIGHFSPARAGRIPSHAPIQWTRFGRAGSFRARHVSIPCAQDAIGRLRDARRPSVTGLPVAGEWGEVRSADRPDERRPAAGRRLQMHRDMAAAAGGEPSNKPCKDAGAGRMIIADIGHQLPALLPDFEHAAATRRSRRHRPAPRTARAGMPRTPSPRHGSPRAARDLVEILHADQLAGEVQQITGIFGPNNCTITGAAVRTYSIA